MAKSSAAAVELSSVCLNELELKVDGRFSACWVPHIFSQEQFASTIVTVSWCNAFPFALLFYLSNYKEFP